MSKLHLIGNAHLDPVWLWRWQEGFAEVLATFKSALDRMREFPDFKFTSACSIYYQWIEKVAPSVFAEIQKRVKEGRWEISGGWVIQPDCNIPDGESFARHALLSQRYFKEKFGITVKTGYNVDSFGHNASLPKILKASGMENYVFMRPMPGEKEGIPSLFNWESDDGSKVCTYRIPFFYNIDCSRLKEFGMIREMAEKDGHDYMAFYGVGNHGGGATIELLNAIEETDMGEKVFSTTEEYFNSIDKTAVPTVKDELQHHARGCYSACSTVKKGNRKGENNLLMAERFATMATELTGAEYPKDALNKAWKNVLFNQFHDILGGCSIKSAYDDAALLYGEAMSLTEEVINDALQRIAWNIDTLQGEKLPTNREWKVWIHEVLGTPVVVFNPHAYPVRMPVTVNSVAKKVTDLAGKEIPLQIVRGEQTNCDDKYATSFTAEVEPFGYRVYRMYLEKESEVNFEKTLLITERSLENDKIKVEFSGVTGDICKFIRKGTEEVMINRPCRAILLDETDCDTWAHDKVYLGEETGVFTCPTFKIIEEGNVRITLRVTTTCADSVLQRDYTLFAGSEEVTVKTKIDFHEKHKTLKFTFPLTDETVQAKIPYGTVSRKGYTGEEPCGSWIASGKVCVANDCKYGYDTKEEEMRMTVLRGAIFADHFGNRDDFCPYMDMGIHEFTYSVYPYENNADAEQRASTLNFGLRHIVGCFHEGNLPEAMSCLEGDMEGTVVTAIKKTEDTGETLLRLCEMNGEEKTLRLALFGKELTATMPHNGIKSLTGDKEVNLIEE